MSLKIDRAELEIVIKNDKARQKIIELEDKMRATNRAMKAAKKEFGESSEVFKKQQDILKGLQKEYDAVVESIGLNNLSVKELAKRSKELNQILRTLSPNTAAYKTYSKQLNDVNKRLKELKRNGKEVEFSLAKMADGFNRYGAIAASVIASLTGVAMTARKCVDEYAQMVEAESQVMKYTGMTKEQVDDLNESLKKIDTRTSRTRLNELAGDAGRLGISAKKDVIEFIEAADMINVALGEDLGEDAVKNIGKLHYRFTEDTMSMKEGMLAIGSAINSVAQNSSASEQYLVEFTARMAGVGKQAKMSITDIMGFASALDQNMLRSEMASTALQGLILKLYQEPAKFAKLAGIEVKTFTNMMSKDANEAVLLFLQSLGKLGSMDKLAPILKEMKLEGAEAAGVISALASSVNIVRKEQRGANAAFLEGQSIIDEYNVQNNTVQAGLDKAKKHFTEIRIELGEQLLPTMKFMVTTGSLTVKMLSSLVSLLKKYKGIIVTTTASIAAYTAATKLSTLWVQRNTEGTLLNVVALKAKDTWLKAVTAGHLLHRAAVMKSTMALKVLWHAMKLHPLGLIAGALTAVTTAFFMFRNRTQEADKVVTNFFSRISDEQSALDKLYHQLKNTAEGTQERNTMVQKFNDTYGAYLPNLLSEKSTLEDIKTAYENVTIAMRNKIAQEMLSEKTKSLKTESLKEESDILLDIQNRLGENISDGQIGLIMPKIVSYVDEMIQKGYTVEQVTDAITRSLGRQFDVLNNRKKDGSLGAGTLGDIRQDLQDYVEQVKDTADKVQVVKKRLNPFLSGGDKGYQSPDVSVTKTVTKNPTLGGGSDNLIAQAKAKMEAELRALHNKHTIGLIEEEKYQQDVYNLQLNFLAKKRELLLTEKWDTSEVDQDIIDLMTQEINRKYDKSKLKNKEFKEIDTSSIEEEDQEEDTYVVDKFKKTNDAKLAILEAMHNAGLISEEQYQDMLTELTSQKEQERNDIEAQKLKEREEKQKASIQAVADLAGSLSQLMSAMQDNEISKVSRKYDKEIKAAKKAGKDTTKLEEEKEAEIAAVKKKYADKQFAMAVLQITSTTAITAMEAYKAMAGIPVVGPALGAAAAAAAVIAGAAQIAVAKQQRDEAKGLYSGGYSDEYTEGYTARGNSHDVAGVIPVHKNEFVTNHAGVANPHVRQFLDVFDLAQKDGTIGMINTTQILERVRFSGGKADGGYTDDGSSSGLATTDMGTVLKLILSAIRENGSYLANIQDKDLTVDARSIRDRIRTIENLERNARR